MEVREGRYRELAEFLRSRRERLSPAALGLPVGARRRTPGLRREEVAQLAGVGVTWYTWLEQGRRINVSAQVLAAIAGTLRLDSSERAHLFTLAGVLDPVAPRVHEPVAGPVLAMLNGIRPFPAYVINGRWDLLAYNPEASALLGGFDGVPPAERNIMWLAFGRGALAGRLLNPDDEAARHVALFRAAMADHTDDPRWQRLRDDLLAASPSFRTHWERYEIGRPTSRVKSFRHPDIGVLRFEVASLFLADSPHCRMLVYTPADAQTGAGVRRLSPREEESVVAACTRASEPVATGALG